VCGDGTAASCVTTAACLQRQRGSVGSVQLFDITAATAAAAGQTSTTAHQINAEDEYDTAGNHDDVGQRHPATACRVIQRNAAS